MVSWIDASSHNFFASRLFSVRIDLPSRIPGMCVYCAGMTTKLAEKTQDLNATLLENIKKDSSIESESFTLTSFLSFF
jgi:hypothetical protein